MTSVASGKSNALKYPQAMDNPLRDAIEQTDLPALVERYYPDSGARPGRKAVVCAVWRGDEHESLSLFRGEGNVWLYHDHRTRESGNAFGFLTDICGLSKTEAAEQLLGGRGEAVVPEGSAAITSVRRSVEVEIEPGEAVYDALVRAVADNRVVRFEHPVSRVKLSKSAALACVKSALETPHAKENQRVLETAHKALKDLARRRRAKRREGKPVAFYDYLDEQGRLLYQVVRLEPKGFSQRRPFEGVWAWGLVAGTYVRGGSGNLYLEDELTPDETERTELGACPLVLYRLNAVKKAVAKGRPIYIVEGEEDVRALEALGLIATCNAGGAGKWDESYSEALRGGVVTILPDNDEAGEDHARKVSEGLSSTAERVRVVCLPDLPQAGDVRDWLQTRSRRELFAELAKQGR